MDLSAFNDEDQDLVLNDEKPNKHIVTDGLIEPWASKKNKFNNKTYLIKHKNASKVTESQS